jgi:transposase
MKPYSYDLRLRIFNYSLNHSVRATARMFRVSPNTVYLLKKLFVETGGLQARTPTHDPPYAISTEGEMHLRLLLSSNVDMTLEELCDCYERIYGKRVGVTTMHNTLKRLNITRKRKTFRDPKRYTDQAEADKLHYDAQVESVEPDNRLYLDETGSCLNMTPAYGRSPQGQRAYAEKPTSPGISVGTVALLSVRGIVAAFSYVGSMTAQRLVNYVFMYVLPILATGQVLIMDRHPVHYAQLTQDYLEANGVKFIYLPAYSPELNPIEEAFSKIKNLIKRQKPRTLEALFESINSAISRITPDDAEGYFNHADEF